MRVRATIAWSAVATVKSQNTQVTAVASRFRVTSRPSRLRGLRSLSVGADIGNLVYRLSLLSRIVNNDSHYVNGGFIRLSGGAKSINRMLKAMA